MQAPAGESNLAITPWGIGRNVRSQLQGSFELVLTDDLPNGPYGEFGMTGGGKLFCTPNSTYNDVAVVLQAAWIKSRGSMMQLNSHDMVGNTSQYCEDWCVMAIEYKGGTVTPEQQASAGTHTAQLGLVQSVGPAGCCVIA